MKESTQIADWASASASTPGVLPFGTDVFVYDPTQVPAVSSGTKRVYCGVYHCMSGTLSTGLAAVAKFFAPDAVEKFGRESAALARGSVIGVGPQLLQVTCAAPPGETAPVPVIVEEYAGVKLSAAIGGAPIPAAGEAAVEQRLFGLGDADGEKQAAKIAYDLMLHVRRLHSAGVCHGDLKASNVCVRSIGIRPWDVRATLIDFDLESPLATTPPRERTPAYYDRLFKDVPAALGAPGQAHPSAFELDLACLSAVCLEVERGQRIDQMDPLAIATAFDEGHMPFGYTAAGSLRTWRIDSELHLKPLAERAGMVPVARYFAGFSDAFTDRALMMAEAQLKGGAYLDAEDARRIEAMPEVQLMRCEHDVAHAVFDDYCANLRAAGEAPDYQTFEQQPAELRESCYRQAADLCEKVTRLGYALVRADDSSKRKRIAGLDEDQVEALARWEHERWLDERLSLGWTFGPERNAEKRTSPYLVPYDQLEEDVKETRNRAPMRNALALLQSAGLAVVKE